MPFLPPNQQRQSTEGRSYESEKVKTGLAVWSREVNKMSSKAFKT